jgi:F-type H+-transporting ATPase subunit b
MLIDWFTVGAQIVNFLALVWLLKHFLYGRILRAIDMREKRIATQLAEAAAKETQASGQLALYESRLEEFERQRDGMLAQARADAEQQHAALLEKAREHVRGLEAKWQEDLERNRQSFLQDLRHRIVAEVLALTRRLTAELTGMELEQCAIQVFLRKIRSLDQKAWRQLAAGDLCLRSALELSDDQRTQIRQTVEERLGTAVHLRFEQASGAGLGLEIRGNGWRIGWNSEAYLQALEEDLSEALNQSSGADTLAAKTAS